LNSREKLSLKNPYTSLLEISENISTIHDSTRLFEKILDTAMETLTAERGFILLNMNGSTQSQEIVTARNMNRETISSIRQLSSSVVEQVLTSSKPVLSIDAQADERFAGAESVVVQQIKSVICTPLINQGKPIGVIYMDRRLSARQFDEASLHFLEAFSHQAAVAINNARLVESLQSENKKLRKQVGLNQLFPEIIGNSEAMQRILQMVRDVADSTASVLIDGESGTGKELIARALHRHSSRFDQPFIPIFCGSLADNLLESELFGHKKGAFTGATENKTGLFEVANHGTLFLDEIAEVSGAIQTKLLRVIQEGEIKRVGDTQIRNVDVRIISATNKDLTEEVKAGRFREDLYYRLNVIRITLPPLRERFEDIIRLAGHFLDIYGQKNKKYSLRLSAEAANFLKDYHWPGNVRELENAIERATILTKDQIIGPDLFQLNNFQDALPLGKTLDEINKFVILKTIEIVGNNRTKAAQMLGVSRRWLQYRLKDWGYVNGN